MAAFTQKCGDPMPENYDTLGLAANKHPGVGLSSLALNHPLPPPSLHAESAAKGQLRILALADAFNTMTQRTAMDLKDQHIVVVILAPSESAMIKAVETYRPDVVIAPFLTARVPQVIWSKLPCLIIHPGPLGDKGPNSIDWALKECVGQWGVTVLQADAAWDAGDIWATVNFALDEAALRMTKSAFYRSLCVPAASSALRQALERLQQREAPSPLTRQLLQGGFKPKMTTAERAADFSKMTAVRIAQLMRISDSRPGMLHSFPGVPGKWFLFGGREEASVEKLHILDAAAVTEGGILGHRDGAILVLCAQNTAVWVSHLKQLNTAERAFFKLPATMALPAEVVHKLPFLTNTEPFFLPFGKQPSTLQEIYAWLDERVCYLHFNFYNGAMSTPQCKALASAVDSLAKDGRFDVLALCGSEAFFSNGIHLNVIEASDDPAAESWSNIAAMNKVVRAIMSTTNKLTASVVLGNAGAGGAMLAIAADLVLAHEDVVFNPHYRRMHLRGSEYWTFNLPRKVGKVYAEQLTQEALPLLAAKAQQVGFVDKIIAGARSSFWPQVKAQLDSYIANAMALKIAKCKGIMRDAEYFAQADSAAAAELQVMRHNFADPAYHRARAAFVYKRKTCTSNIKLS